jgi:predicted house-cleaning noncanonical NTP pyrophosphatase (MazG superfamily)
VTEKLVRNGPGQRIRAEGGVVRVADRHEMLGLLARKLVEEAQEVLALADDPNATGYSSITRLVEELGDVTEVIRGLRRVASIRKDDIRVARRAKRLREGDFDDRLVWERT